MSLWDTDKNNSSRKFPHLNQRDQQIQRLAQGVTSLNPVTDVTDEDTTAAYTGAFQIVYVGTATLTIPNPPVAGTFYLSDELTHNLGYLPAFIAYVTPSSTYIAAQGDGVNAEVPWMLVSSPVTVSGTPILGLSFILDVNTITETTIRFYARASSAFADLPGDWSIKVYLLRDPLN